MALGSLGYYFLTPASKTGNTTGPIASAAYRGENYSGADKEESRGMNDYIPNKQTPNTSSQKREASGESKVAGTERSNKPALDAAGKAAASTPQTTTTTEN